MKKTIIMMAASLMAASAHAQIGEEVNTAAFATDSLIVIDRLLPHEDLASTEIPPLPAPVIYTPRTNDVNPAPNPDPNPDPVEIDDSHKKDYEHYNKVFKTTFKGNEDLAFLKELESWLGTPYLYGGTTKGKGTDCSGFVMTAYKNCYNIKLNRIATYEPNDCNKVGRNELEFGDLLFFANDNGYIYHVGIYLANDIFIHAASSNHIGVRTETLKLNYYVKAYYSAGRVKQLDKRNKSQQETSRSQVDNEIAAKQDSQPVSNQQQKASGNAASAKTYNDYEQIFGVQFKGVESLDALGELSSWLNTPYKSGGSEKGVGCDSPGLVTSIFKDVWKISLNRDPEKMMKNLTKADKKSLNFGDIVFFKKNNTYPIIGFYIGQNKVVYASVSKGVSVLDINTVRNYNLHFCGHVPALNN